MSPIDAAGMDDLLAGPPSASAEPLAEGATLLRRFAEPEAASLLAALQLVLAAAPFRHMVTPGGWRMSVAMTSSGLWQAHASPTAVTTLEAPGPVVVMATPSRPVARA